MKDVVCQQPDSRKMNQVPKKDGEACAYKKDADGETSLKGGVDQRFAPSPLRPRKTHHAIHRDERVGENGEIAEETNERICQGQSFGQHAGEGHAGLEQKPSPRNGGHQAHQNTIAFTHSAWIAEAAQRPLGSMPLLARPSLRPFFPFVCTTSWCPTMIRSKSHVNSSRTERS